VSSLLLLAAAFSFCSISLVLHWFSKPWNRDSRVSTLLPVVVVVVVVVCSEDTEASPRVVVVVAVAVSPSHGSASGSVSSSSSWKLHLLRECSSVKLLVCSVRWSSAGIDMSSSTVLISFLGCSSFFDDLFLDFRFLSDRSRCRCRCRSRSRLIKRSSSEDPWSWFFFFLISLLLRLCLCLFSVSVRLVVLIVCDGFWGIRIIFSFIIPVVVVVLVLFVDVDVDVDSSVTCSPRCSLLSLCFVDNASSTIAEGSARQRQEFGMST